MSPKVINISLILIFSICSYFLMKFNYDGFQSKFINQYFSISTNSSNNKFPQVDGFYFAIYSIILNIVKWILSLSQKLSSYKATVQRILLNSFDYFIIVFLLMFYLMRRKSNNKQLSKQWNKQSNDRIELYGYWFIFGRLNYGIGYILTTLTGLNLKVSGVAMTYILILLMIGDCFDINLFRMFDIGFQIPFQL